MHEADIIAKLKKAGYPQKRLANELDCSRTAINRVIYADSTSNRIANKIASIIGKPAKSIWPGKYPNETKAA